MNDTQTSRGEQAFAVLTFTAEGSLGEAPYDRSHYSTVGHESDSCPTVVLAERTDAHMRPARLADMVRRGALQSGCFNEWFAEMDGFDGEVVVDSPLYCGLCGRAGNTPAEPRQLAVLRDVFAARRGDPMAEALRTAALDMWRAGTLSAVLADQYLAAASAIDPPTAARETAPQPPPRRTTGQHPSLHLEVGHYAVDLDGRTRFFAVEEGKGRWSGRLFVAEVIGGRSGTANLTRAIAVAARKAILADVYERPARPEYDIEAATLTGPAGAALRYADEIGRCTSCNRRLTMPESRARGMGPECAKR